MTGVIEMWFGKTYLFPESELTEEQLAVHARSVQLYEHEMALRAFSLGDASIDLAQFTASEARFIDIYATVRKFRPEFRPEHIFGINPDGLVVTSGEGRGFWDSFVYTF